MESSFDELPAEERAFVLQHLSGREEYERMRALLLGFSDDDDARHAPADPAVREHVLEVFRAQQRPRHTIWLNSMAAFLLPQRPADRWRTALALGSVALLISLAVLAPWADRDPAPGGIAQLREVQAPAGSTRAEKSTPDITTASNATANGTATREGLTDAGTALNLEAPPTAAAASVTATATVDAPQTDLEHVVAEAPADDQITTVQSPAVRSGKDAKADAQPFSHLVEADELLTNQSMAGASSSPSSAGEGAVALRSVDRKRRTGRTREVEDKVAGAGTVMDPAPYLGMLRAAW